MIQAVSWFCAEHCGLYLPGGKSWEKRSPVISGSAEIPEVIGRAVKYYARMTTETRYCLCAASVAMKEMGWDGGEREIGLLSAGSDGCAKANEEYFRDYVANGRTLGRGNLFIYTLPTSALGEVAIALSLRGPSACVYENGRPLGAMVRHAQEIIADREADKMLVLWSDPEAAVCLAVDGQAGEESVYASLLVSELKPAQVIGDIQSRLGLA